VQSIVACATSISISHPRFAITVRQHPWTAIVARARRRQCRRRRRSLRLV